MTMLINSFAFSFNLDFFLLEDGSGLLLLEAGGFLAQE